MSSNERSKWEYLLFRVLYMIFFWLVSRIAWVFLGIFALVQLVFVMVRGEKQPTLLDISASTVTFVEQCATYLTFNSEYKPFPFNDWPDVSAREGTDSNND